MPLDREQTCPVCRSPEPTHFAAIGELIYWRCPNCVATWLDPTCRPTAENERAHYRLHENRDDAGYRNFLNRLATPLLQKVEPARSGLDFGCGPGPLLAQMLVAAGHQMAVYDPFFADTPEVLEDRYDFITCTEVVEHFHNPAREFDRFDTMLKPGGWLGIMTCFQTDDARFADWHYRRDPTHVVFYREDTLRHVARQRGWTCEIPGKDVALMQKTGEDNRG